MFDLIHRHGHPKGIKFTNGLASVMYRTTEEARAVMNSLEGVTVNGYPVCE